MAITPINNPTTKKKPTNEESLPIITEIKIDHSVSSFFFKLDILTLEPDIKIKNQFLKMKVYQILNRKNYSLSNFQKKNATHQKLN